MTTAEKVLAMRDHLAAVNPDDMPPAARDFALNLQIARGLGFDPFELILPDDPHELDEMIDGAIGLLLELRGDDLPPIDLARFGLPVAPGRVEAEGIAEVCRKLAAGDLKTPQDVITELRRLEVSA